VKPAMVIMKVSDRYSKQQLDFRPIGGGGGEEEDLDDN
jgi:hypothetical protein